MKLTIITINYNNVDGLKKTLESILHQSSRTFEYIVIDGGSDDGSKELVEKSDGIDFWISERDGGIYDAMNKGIENAAGDYLLFINSGDRLFEMDTIARATAQLDGTPIVYGDLKWELEPTQLTDGCLPDVIDLRQMMTNTLWHPASFIKRDLFLRHGFYDISYKICGDYDFFFNVIIDKKVRHRHIHQFIAVFDFTGISAKPESGTVMADEKKRVQRRWLSEEEIDRFWRYEGRRQVIDRGRYALRHGRRLASRWVRRYL